MIEYLRSFRIDDYAIFDIVVAFVGLYLLSPLLTKLFLKIKIKISKLSWIYLTLPIGVMVHLLVGQDTQMTKDLFDPTGHYFIKFLMVLLLYMGIKEIRRSN